MRNHRYLVPVILLALIAIGWRIMHPPKPPVPGPLGSPPKWRATNAIGKFAGLQFNKDYSYAAAVWVRKNSQNGTQAGLRLINIIDQTQNAIRLPSGYQVLSLSWSNDKILVMSRISNNETVISEVDKATNHLNDIAKIPAQIDTTLSWPTDSNSILCANSVDGTTVISAYGLDGNLIGKTISIPETHYMKWGQTSIISKDGKYAVVSLITKEDSYPNYYYCDFHTGQYRLIGSGSDFPGRVLDLIVGQQGVLAFCILGDKVRVSHYDLLTKKLETLNSVPLKWSPSTIWPDFPMEVVYFTSENAVKIDIPTLSSSKIIDLRKSAKDNPSLRAQVRGAKGAVMKNGDVLSFIFDSTGPDIRRFTKDGDEILPVLIP